MRPHISIRGFVHPSVGWLVRPSVTTFFKTVNLAERSLIVIPDPSSSSSSSSSTSWARGRGGGRGAGEGRGWRRKRWMHRCSSQTCFWCFSTSTGLYQEGQWVCRYSITKNVLYFERFIVISQNLLSQVQNFPSHVISDSSLLPQMYTGINLKWQKVVSF